MKIKKYNENVAMTNEFGDDILEGQDFYELLQTYRHTPRNEYVAVKKSFEDIKDYIRENFLAKDEKIVKEWLLENDAKKYNL